MSTMRITTVDELVAAVPHMIGFEVTESLVVISHTGAPVACRIDHPHGSSDLLDAAACLGAAYRQYGGTVSLVSFTEHARDAKDVLTCVSAVLSEVCTVQGLIHVTPRGGWTEHVTGATGTVSDEVRTRMAAEFVTHGFVAPLGSRDDLRRSLLGDPAPVEASVGERRTALAVNRHDVDWLHTEVAWVTQSVADFHTDRAALDDHTAARLLVALTCEETRSAVAIDLTRDHAEADVDLWRDLTRRAPLDLRTGPALMLAIAAWMAGQGALSWVAYDVADDPQHVLARLVSRVLTEATPPTENLAALVS